jgi:hypothetical protein
MSGGALVPPVIQRSRPVCGAPRTREAQTTDCDLEWHRPTIVLTTPSTARPKNRERDENEEER